MDVRGRSGRVVRGAVLCTSRRTGDVGAPVVAQHTLQLGQLTHRPTGPVAAKERSLDALLGLEPGPNK